MSSSQQTRIPRLRFPEFSGEWEEKKLGEVGYFYYGKSAPKYSLSDDAPTPCVRYGELYTKFHGKIDKIYSYTNIDPERLVFSKGTEVLIPRVGEDPLDFANASYLPIANVAIGEMISVYNTDHNKMFVVSYINSHLKKEFAKLVEGGSVANLYYRYLEDVEASFPSLPEQSKIAEFLTAVDKRIEHLTTLREQWETYKTGMMQGIFSQEIRFVRPDGSAFPEREEKKLGKIAKIKTGNLNAKDATEDGEYVFFDRSVDIKRNNEYTFDNEALIYPGEGSEFLPRYFYGKHGLHQRAYAIFDGKGVIMKYLYYYLLTQNRHFLRMAVGSTVPSLRMDSFQTCLIKLPSISEQERIASFLSEIDNKILKIDKLISLAQKRKRGLLERLFI